MMLAEVITSSLAEEVESLIVFNYRAEIHYLLMETTSVRK